VIIAAASTCRRLDACLCGVVMAVCSRMASKFRDGMCWSVLVSRALLADCSPARAGIVQRDHDHSLQDPALHRDAGHDEYRARADEVVDRRRTITRLGDTMAFVGGEIAGIPVVVWIPAMLVLLFILISRKTRYGRHVYAIGGNEQAARLSGLPVRRIKLATICCAACFRRAALILNARLDSATWSPVRLRTECHRGGGYGGTSPAGDGDDAGDRGWVLIIRRARTGLVC